MPEIIDGQHAAFLLKTVMLPVLYMKTGDPQVPRLAGFGFHLPSIVDQITPLGHHVVPPAPLAQVLIRWRLAFARFPMRAIFAAVRSPVQAYCRVHHLDPAPVTP